VILGFGGFFSGQIVLADFSNQAIGRFFFAGKHGLNTFLKDFLF
jgi:hypothetical protein